VAGTSPLTQNSNINGVGQYYLPDGSFLQACSFNNELIGSVRYIKTNGDYYQGKVLRNKANGEGVLCENSIIYTGSFVNNFLNGKGKEESPTYRYEGQYRNGAKTFGKLTWDL
jgi:hypothetical protein